MSSEATPLDENVLEKHKSSEEVNASSYSNIEVKNEDMAKELSSEKIVHVDDDVIFEEAVDSHHSSHRVVTDADEKLIELEENDDTNDNKFADIPQKDVKDIKGEREFSENTVEQKKLIENIGKESKLENEEETSQDDIPIAEVSDTEENRDSLSIDYFMNASDEEENFTLSESQSEQTTEDDDNKNYRMKSSRILTSEKVPQEETVFDRDAYYNLYDKLTEEYEEERMKNIYLQKKLSDFYIRKKMFHVIQEVKVSVDIQKRYDKQIDNLGVLLERMKQETVKMTEDLDDLNQKRFVLENETETLFQKLRQAESEVAKEILSHEDAEMAYHQKAIEICLKRQKNQYGHIIKMRYQYIKLRNKITATQEALNALDNLGPNLRLIDYEQMKINNKNLKDKLEERENELTKVRHRCQNAMQTLAHVREKSRHLEHNIHHLTNRLGTVEEDYSIVRESLNYIMRERNEMRSSIDKMKIKSGLLTKPNLLKDMQNTIEKIKHLSEVIQNYKTEYARTAMIVDKMKEIVKSPKQLEILKLALIEGKDVSVCLYSKESSKESDINCSELYKATES